MMLLLLACHPASTEPPVESAVDPTWTAARAVLDENCARCHTDGGQAPSFDDPATAAALAATMVAYTESGRMPPAAPDPSCAPYEGSDTFTLDDTERAALVAWADAGAPVAGAPTSTPASGPVSGPFDLELFGGAPYTPSFGEDGNDYRCFLLPVGNATATYLTGMEALVDALPIVHHVVIFQVENGQGIPADVEDPTQGFACSGLGEQGWNFVGAWAPGANPVLFPEGSGMRLPKQAELVLQMHYFDSFDGADQVADRSGYGLHLADSVDRRVYQFPLGSTSFTIPAGDPAYVVSESYDWDSGPLDILGVWPHMHVVGAGFDERLVHPDDSESCLLHQDGWNFHNQVFGRLTTPVRLDDGDRIDVTCTYNNSTSNPDLIYDPPVDVTFGEETNNEMCFGFTYAIEPE